MSIEHRYFLGKDGEYHRYPNAGERRYRKAGERRYPKPDERHQRQVRQAAASFFTTLFVIALLIFLAIYVHRVNTNIERLHEKPKINFLTGEYSRDK